MHGAQVKGGGYDAWQRRGGVSCMHPPHTHSTPLHPLASSTPQHTRTHTCTLPSTHAPHPPHAHATSPVQELGHAGLTKRSASCVLVLPKPLKKGAGVGEGEDDFDEAYGDVFAKVQGQQVVWSMQ